MSEAEIAAVDLELEKEHKVGTKTKKVHKVCTKNKNSKTKALTAAQVEEDSDESGDEEKEEQSMTLKRKKGGAATDNDGWQWASLQEKEAASSKERETSCHQSMQEEWCRTKATTWSNVCSLAARII